MSFPEISYDHNLPYGGESLHVETAGIGDQSQRIVRLTSEQQRFIISEVIISPNENTVSLNSQGVSALYALDSLQLQSVLIRSTQLVEDEADAMYIEFDGYQYHATAVTIINGEIEYTQNGIRVYDDVYDRITLQPEMNIDLDKSASVVPMTVSLEERVEEGYQISPVLIVDDGAIDDHLVVQLTPPSDLRTLLSEMNGSEITQNQAIDIADILRIATYQTIFLEKNLPGYSE